MERFPSKGPLAKETAERLGPHLVLPGKVKPPPHEKLRPLTGSTPRQKRRMVDTGPKAPLTPRPVGSSTYHHHHAHPPEGAQSARKHDRPEVLRLEGGTARNSKRAGTLSPTSTRSGSQRGSPPHHETDPHAVENFLAACGYKPMDEGPTAESTMRELQEGFHQFQLSADLALMDFGHHSGADVMTNRAEVLEKVDIQLGDHATVDVLASLCEDLAEAAGTAGGYYLSMGDDGEDWGEEVPPVGGNGEDVQRIQVTSVVGSSDRQVLGDAGSGKAEPAEHHATPIGGDLQSQKSFGRISSSSSAFTSHRSRQRSLGYQPKIRYFHEEGDALAQATKIPMMATVQPTTTSGVTGGSGGAGILPPGDPVNKRTLWAQLTEAQASVQSILGLTRPGDTKHLTHSVESATRWVSTVRGLCKTAAISLHNATALLLQSQQQPDDDEHAPSSLPQHGNKFSVLGSSTVLGTSVAPKPPARDSSYDMSEFIVSVSFDRPKSMSIDLTPEAFEKVKTLFRSLVCNTVTRCGGRMVKESEDSSCYICSFSSGIEAFAWERAIQQYSSFLPWPAECLDVSYMKEVEGEPQDDQVELQAPESPLKRIVSNTTISRVAQQKQNLLSTAESVSSAFSAHIHLAVSKFRDSVLDGDSVPIPDIGTAHGKRICARGPRIVGSIHFGSVVDEFRKARFSANPLVTATASLIGLGVGGQTVVSPAAIEELTPKALEVLGATTRSLKLNSKANHPELRTLVSLGETSVQLINWTSIPSRESIIQGQTRHNEYEPNWWLHGVPSFTARGYDGGYLRNDPVKSVTSQPTQVDEADLPEAPSGGLRRKGSATARRLSRSARSNSQSPVFEASAVGGPGQQPRRKTRRSTLLTQHRLAPAGDASTQGHTVATYDVETGTDIADTATMGGITRWVLQSARRMYQWTGGEIEEEEVLRQLFAALGIETLRGDSEEHTSSTPSRHDQKRSSRSGRSKIPPISVATPEEPSLPRMTWETLVTHYEDAVEIQRGSIFRDDPATVKAAVVGHFLAVKDVLDDLADWKQRSRRRTGSTMFADDEGEPSTTPPYTHITAPREKRGSMVRILFEDVDSVNVDNPPVLLPDT